MQAALLVGAGGFVGSVLRYLISQLAQRLFATALLPVGTLIVNVVGCFAIGVLVQLAEAKDLFGEPARCFLIVGVLGGFTTFSAFGHETMQLARTGEAWLAFSNVLVQVGLGLGAVWGGQLAIAALLRA